MTKTDRALFTGLAVIAPNGSTTKLYWDAVQNGVSGLGPISAFEAKGYPVQVVGEVSDFAAAEVVEGRLVVQTDRWTQLALAATDRAIEDASLSATELAGYQTAVITATSSAGNEFGQREIQKLWSKGARFVGPYQSIAWFYAATSGQISIKHDMKGPCGVVVAEQAGGLDALAHSRRALRSDAKLVFTGGTEAPIGPYAITCQAAAGLFSPATDPRQAYLPFDVAANGYVPGEGGAILVMEHESTALARDAQVYGELAGYAATFDPRPGSDRPSGLRRAITGALADAQTDAADIDVVFADASAVPDADRREAAAIAEVFGPGGVPVTAPKCMVGRLYAGGAPLDVATALLSIRDGVIPGTPAGTELAPDCPIDLVRETRHASVRTALVLARGYDGFNSAVVLRSA